MTRQYVSDSLLSIRMTAARPPTIALSGLAGRSYQIQAVDNLAASGSNNWQPLTSSQLTTNPLLWPDATAANSSGRFYRGALLP